jgi:hypothetical protein
MRRVRGFSGLRQLLCSLPWLPAEDSVVRQAIRALTAAPELSSLRHRPRSIRTPSGIMSAIGSRADRLFRVVRGRSVVSPIAWRRAVLRNQRDQAQHDRSESYGSKSDTSNAVRLHSEKGHDRANDD